MKSAEAWVVRTSSSLPGKLQATSPLPYQSNSGPTSSLSSAMNPSRETTAPMITLPMISSSRSPSLSSQAEQLVPSCSAHLVAEVQDAGCLQPPDQVELDVFGREALEQAPALAEQHRHELDLEDVEQPGLQALLGCVGAVQQDVPIARGRLCPLHARLDALGHEVHPLVGVVRRSGVGGDEDRHAVVVVAAPVVGEVAGPPSGDDGTGRQHLV